MKKICSVTWLIILFALIASTPMVSAQVFTNLHSFVNGDTTDGALPNGVVLVNNTLMGATSQGGSSGNGTLFQASTNGTGFGIIHNFDGEPADGSSPNELIISGNLIYGTTYLGGSNGVGTIYRIGTNGTGYTVLKHFAAGGEPQNSVSALVLGGATLYGMSLGGGSSNWGTVFKIDTNGGNFSVIHHFTNNPDGASPRSQLLLLNGTLFGTTTSGGTNGAGTVFRMNTNGGDYSVLWNCSGSPSAATPFAGLAAYSNVLYGVSAAGGTENAGSVFRLGTNGSGFSVIHSFTNNEGLSPQGVPTIVNGVLYGNTISRGTGFGGTVFRVETNGANFVVLQNFTNAQTGANPKGLLAVNGTTIFGIANGGGPSFGGTLFRLQLVPAITSQPQNLTVTNGNPAIFSVTALDETPVTYQWYFNNGLLGGQTNSSLTIAVAGNGNVGNYLVVVADKFGSVTSSPAILTVLSAPIITSQPQSMSATNGNPASFSVSVTGAPAFTYQWYFNTNTVLAGETNNILNLSFTTNSSAGAYTVVITDTIGSTTSSPAILTVVMITKPVITGQPQDLTVTNGDIASFSVTNTGQAPLFYQWYSNSVNTAVGTLLAGRTNATLSYTNVGTNFNGRYYTIIITNALGKATSSPALLTVISRPVIASNPQPATVYFSSNASFSVSALGANLRFQWYSNSVNTAIGTLLAGRTNTTLNFTNVGTNFNARYFSAVVSNSFGRATSSPALLTVISTPTILAQPQPATATLGSATNFSVLVAGLTPLRYQWYFNTNLVLTNQLGNALAGRTNTLLDFTSVSNSLAGYYSIIATNALGRATSSPALLTIGAALFITQQPSNAIVTNGNFVSFTSAASGEGTLSHQWLFNTNTPILGATSTNLVITNANQAGAYSMKVTNSSGAATSSPAILTVIAQPRMLASGFDPVSGSYAFSFVNVAGSTNRLWTSTNLADSGAWAPLVTNIMTTNGFWFFTDSNSAKTNALRFYRFSTP